MQLCDFPSGGQKWRNLLCSAGAQVHCLAFSSKQPSLLAAGNALGRVVVWDVGSNEPKLLTQATLHQVKQRP